MKPTPPSPPKCILHHSLYLKDTYQVRTDSRYGIKTFFRLACSESADMTFPNVSKDLLILTPSCRKIVQNVLNIKQLLISQLLPQNVFLDI